MVTSGYVTADNNRKLVWRVIVAVVQVVSGKEDQKRHGSFFQI